MTSANMLCCVLGCDWLNVSCTKKKVLLYEAKSHTILKLYEKTFKRVKRRDCFIFLYNIRTIIIMVQ